jgi:hypothetical protein
MQFQRFHDAVARRWAKDDEVIVKMWREGATIEQIQTKIPVSERTIWEVLEIHGEKEK